MEREEKEAEEGLDESEDSLQDEEYLQVKNPESKGMPAIIKKSLDSLLKAAQRAINKNDMKKLELLSEKSIYDAMIYQDEDSLSLAVVLFAISKLIKRETEDTEYPSDLRNYLASAQFSLNEGNADEYRDKVKKTVEFIASTDKQFKLYVEKVMEKAQIKKGSSLYERGISVARAADFLGIGQWELMSYIGKTKIHDKSDEATRVGERIRIARGLFR